MSDSAIVVLREFLVGRYEELRHKLTLHLGSADMASDALQETWLRLENGKEPIEPVQYPLSYLMRMAINTALDRIRSERRYLGGDEVDQILLGFSDPTPDPATTVGARMEAQRLADVMEEMPARRRHILILIRVDELSRQEVADRLGISLSLVDRELKRAHEYVVDKMR